MPINNMKEKNEKQCNKNRQGNLRGCNNELKNTRCMSDVKKPKHRILEWTKGRSDCMKFPEIKRMAR